MIKLVIKRIIERISRLSASILMQEMDFKNISTNIFDVGEKLSHDNVKLSSNVINLSGNITKLSDETNKSSRDVNKLSMDVTNLSGDSTKLARDIIILSSKVAKLSNDLFNLTEERERAFANSMRDIEIERIVIYLESMASKHDTNRKDKLARELTTFYRTAVDNLRREQAFSQPRGKSDDFGDDSGTLDYVKSKNIYIPGNEATIELSRQSVPWAFMFGQTKTAVFLVCGQSNAANHGEGKYTPRHDVFALNFMTLSCHRAEDPLPGASGDGGSIWPRLGDLLIESHVFKRVLFISVAFGGSFVSDWSTDTTVQRRLTLTLSRLRKHLASPFVPINAVLWQQGEAEANHTEMSAATYASHLRNLFEVIRNHGVFCPIFVAQATHCEVGDHPFNNQPAIRQAQLDIVDVRRGVLKGPDIDTILGEGRSDGCHLSASGLQRAAELWADVLIGAGHVIGKYPQPAESGQASDLPTLGGFTQASMGTP